MPDSIEQIDTAALADEVVERLDPGTVIDDKVILSRRQLVAIAGSGLSAGALAALGVDRATAQEVGQVGTDTDPVDVKAWNLDVQNGAQFNGSDLLDVGTADVERVETKPSGALVGLSEPQDLADGAIEEIRWDDPIRDPDGLLDGQNNVVSVPDWASYCRMQVSFRFDSSVQCDLVRSAPSPRGGLDVQDISYDWSRERWESKWFDVSDEDDVSVEIRIVTGSTETLSDSKPTEMEAWFI